MIRNLLIMVMACSFAACSSGGSSENQGNESAEKEEVSPEESVKLEQYMVAGESLYNQYCYMCHQTNGEGLTDLYPPLAESDYMENNFEEVICILRYGKSGEIVVNGKTYNQLMPEQPMLKDLEIAEIATYIYNSWGHSRGLIPVTEVTELLSNCEGAN